MEENKAKKNKSTAPKARRRQHESNRLDGLVQNGARSLLEHCVLVRVPLHTPSLIVADRIYQKVAQNIDDVDELGDLPQALLHRLSQILSKRRVLTSHTLNLFLKRELDKIDIYDSGSMSRSYPWKDYN